MGAWRLAPGAYGGASILAPIEWRLRPGALFLLVWRLFAFALENGWRPGRTGAITGAHAHLCVSYHSIMVIWKRMRIQMNNNKRKSGY